jgi:hypothetical protein
VRLRRKRSAISDAPSAVEKPLPLALILGFGGAAIPGCVLLNVKTKNHTGMNACAT